MKGVLLMYPNYQNMPKNYPNNFKNNMYPNDERFIGGFAFPFLLGGVTGAALAPNFWRPPYNRPPYPYPPFPPYGPYYR